MSTHGVELFNSAGVLTYSTKWTTWNFVGSFIVPAATPVRKDFDVLSLFNEKHYYRSFINTPLLAGESKVSNITFPGPTGVYSDGTNTVDILIVVLAR
jgi:hypothetical protein